MPAEPTADRATAPGPPPTRWARAGASRGGYATTFADLVATGRDVDGEARLADTLVPRGARILDVGSGMGRVAAALAARGHEVVAVEPDAELVEQSRATYPHLEVIPRDVLALDAATLAAHGHPTEFDLLVCVGNVLVFLAEGTERQVLAHLASMLAPGGRVLAGFHLRGGPAAARRYPLDEFVADVEAAGLRVDLRAGSYELHPAGDEYAVWLLSAATD